MSIFTLLIALVLIGVGIWGVTTFIPMDAGIKKLIRIVGIVIALLIVLNAFGVIKGLSGMSVPSLK